MGVLQSRISRLKLQLSCSSLSDEPERSVVAEKPNVADRAGFIVVFSGDNLKDDSVKRNTIPIGGLDLIKIGEKQQPEQNVDLILSTFLEENVKNCEYLSTIQRY